MKRHVACLVGCAAVLLAVASTVAAQELGPRAAAEGRGRGRGGPPRADQAAPFDTATIPKDDAEKKILDSLDEITRTQGRMMNVPVQDGRLLRLMAETIGAKTVVEIGTSNGISAIWLCAALRKTGGKLITHEIDERRAALARKNFAKAGVADVVTVVEGDAAMVQAGSTVRAAAGPGPAGSDRPRGRVVRKRRLYGSIFHGRGRGGRRAAEPEDLSGDRGCVRCAGDSLEIARRRI